MNTKDSVQYLFSQPLDLHNGKMIAQVHDRHRSREFIELLKELDNHSSHISKETMKYLKSRLGRFVYVHTSRNGSWLNLIETALSKIARTFFIPYSCLQQRGTQRRFY